MEANKDDVKSDGSFRLHVGRIHIVLLYKLLIDLQVSNVIDINNSDMCRKILYQNILSSILK